jgi:thioredoxin 2
MDAQLIRCARCGATNRIALAGAQPQRTPVCGKCKTPLPLEARPLTVTDANFAELVEGSPLPVLLDLWAAWCGPCRQLAPVLDELAAELAGRVCVAKLNIDENPGAAARFDVRSIPTLLIFQQGRVVERITGLRSKRELLRVLERWAGARAQGGER